MPLFSLTAALHRFQHQGQGGKQQDTADGWRKSLLKPLPTCQLQLQKKH